MKEIKEAIRTIANWPKEGIMFRDINSLIQNSTVFQKVNRLFYERYENKAIDKIIAIESRGFIFGSILAEKLGKSLVLARKAGKLPGKTISQEYQLEYGRDRLEIQVDLINYAEKILIVDDLIATGGTALAVAKLVERLGASVLEMAFVIELPDLLPKNALKDYSLFSLVQFAGE